MTASPSRSLPASPETPGQSLWTATAGGPIRSVCLARETGWVFARDAHHWLYLFNRSGERQSQLHSTRELTASACSDDGSAFVTGGKEGELSWLARDLTPRWQTTLPHRVEGIAVDPLGQYVAASDGGSGLHLYTHQGKEVWKTNSPRPLRHLAFVPESPHLLGCADLGLVTCFDAGGKMVWRDALVSSAGSLAVSGDGSVVVVACFSEGLCCYTLWNSKPEYVPLKEPCRLAAVSWDGESILAAGMSSALYLVDRKGRVKAERTVESPVVSLALSPAADRAAVGLANGQVMMLRW